MKLLPCPFCGKTDTLIMADDWDDLAVLDVEPTSDNSFAVTCDFTAGGCGAQGGYRKTPEDAEAAWNARPAAAVDELIEAVRKANGLLDELIRLGKEGMEPDYTRWITFHDKVAELASEARAALTGRGE